LLIYIFASYHSTTTQPKQLLAVACRNAYGNRAGLQLFVAKMSSRLPDWFKNCRNATSALLEAIESEARQRPLAPTANLLLHPSPLWKLFHRLFPLSKGVDEATLRTYADWIDIVRQFRQLHPHAPNDSLFEGLPALITGRWTPPLRYQISTM